MNIHNKRFIVTLIALTLIVLGAVIFLYKQSALTSEQEFNDALIYGALISEQQCLAEAWGQERYNAVVSDPSLMTTEEAGTLNVCIN